MHSIDPALLGALREGLFTSLCTGLACAAAWGLWLLLAPVPAQRFAAAADRWVVSEHWFERLNRPIETARWFYRHHRAAGTLIVVAAVFNLLRWATVYNRAAVLSTLDRHWRSSGMDWLIPALESMFVAFNAVFVIFGLVVLFRPSLLKVPERYANRWVEVRTGHTLDLRFDPLASAVAQHPRLVGALITALCGWLTAQLLTLH